MTDYLIFARKAYPQPLELLGQLRVDGEAPEDKARLVELWEPTASWLAAHVNK